MITKLYNAGKLIISNLYDFLPNSLNNETELEAIDRWIITRSQTTAKEMAREFEQYEYSRARQLFENFFWKDLCDNYLEIVKGRLREIDSPSSAKRASAQYALYHTYLNTLKMISPFLPHITEEMYHAEFLSDGTIVSKMNAGFLATQEKQKSIHLTSWPTNNNLAVLSESEAQGAELMLAVITEIRKYKTTRQMTMGSPLPPIVLMGRKEQETILAPFWNDLISVTRAEKISFQDKNNKIQTDEPVIAI